MSDGDDNIIELRDLKSIIVPEQRSRCGSIILNYGYDDDRDSVMFEGSLTLNEACFLYKLLGKTIDELMEEDYEE